MNPASSNTTSSNNNSTVHFDYYCSEMPFGSIIWAVFSVLCGCVGFPASVWLLWLLIQRQRRGMTNDIYMVNLTIMDLIYNVFPTPIMIDYFAFREPFFVYVDKIMFCLSVIGRPLFMTCICVDCFMAVLYPVTYMKMKHSRYRLLSCAAVWVTTSCIGMTNAFIMSSFSPISGVVCWLLVPIMAICDLAILYTLRKPDPSGRPTVHPQKQRALQTITNSLVMTLVCYLPTMSVRPFLRFMPVSELVKFCVIAIPAYIAPLLGGIVMPLLQLQSLRRLSRLLRYTCDSGSSGSRHDGPAS